MKQQNNINQLNVSECKNELMKSNRNRATKTASETIWAACGSNMYVVQRQPGVDGL